MATIQRGKDFYFTSPVQFVAGGNTATPQPCDLSQWVPAEALSYKVVCSVFHALVDQYGNVDITLVCRLPGYVGTAAGGWNDAEDFGALAGIYDSGQVPGKLMGRLGATLEIPNIDQTFYWFPRGNTTIDCAQSYLQLVSYRMP